MDIILGLVSGAMMVGLAAWFIQEFRWKEKHAELRGQLTRTQDAEQVIQAAKTELNTAFQASAGQALHANSEHFLKLAEQNFDKSKEKFENLVKPLSENYEKLNPNIESLAKQLGSATAETARLANALTDNRQIGSWGEIQLARVLELTGMAPYVDYSEQVTVGSSGERPDVIVHLPDERDVVIDSKASLVAYLEASESTGEESRGAALDRHARALRTQVDNLSRKDYKDKVRGSLEFVVMFVPGDQFLSAALEANSSLVDYAMNKRVVIATPSTLFALLTALEYGWRQYHLAHNVEEIRQAGEVMQDRLKTFMGYYVDVGARLNGAVAAFNKSVGSFDTRLMPQAREFARLRGNNTDEFQPPAQISAEIRTSQYGDDSLDEGDTQESR